MERTPHRPVTVLHTIRSLRVDGVVKVVLRNLAHHDRQRFRHYVCSIRSEAPLADEFRAAGVEPILLGHTGPSTVPRTLRRLRSVLRRHEIDLVHANRTLDLALAGAAARMSRIPVVSTLHWLGRLDEHPEDKAAYSWLRRHGEQHLTVQLNRALATRIVAVSDAVRDSFASLPGFPAERMQVVYPGLDMRQPLPPGTPAGPELRHGLGFDQASPLLLNIGRLDAVKGQRHLIPMMQRLCERRPNAHLMIAGEGALRGELTNAIAAAGLGGSISLLGVRSDVDALLGICDVLVLASESEAAPLPLFEAMRAGRPVVATSVGGVTELVEQGVTGWVVPRGDPAAMADAVERIVGTPGMARRMGDAARRIGLERFDLSVSVRALEVIYDSLTSHPGPAQSPSRLRDRAASPARD